MLETAIKKLTEAVEANTAALAALQGSAPAATSAETPKPSTAKTEPVAEPAPAAEAEPEPTPEPAAPADDVTLKDVTAKVLELGQKKGRQAAVQLLGEYGATKVPDLKTKAADKFGEIVAKIDGLLADK